MGVEINQPEKKIQVNWTKQS